MPIRLASDVAAVARGGPGIRVTEPSAPARCRGEAAWARRGEHRRPRARRCPLSPASAETTGAGAQRAPAATGRYGQA